VQRPSKRARKEPKKKEPKKRDESEEEEVPAAAPPAKKVQLQMIAILTTILNHVAQRVAGKRAQPAFDLDAPESFDPVAERAVGATAGATYLTDRDKYTVRASVVSLRVISPFALYADCYNVRMFTSMSES
jgi:hypothetical protein